MIGVFCIILAQNRTNFVAFLFSGVCCKFQLDMYKKYGQRLGMSAEDYLHRIANYTRWAEGDREGEGEGEEEEGERRLNWIEVCETSIFHTATGA